MPYTASLGRINQLYDDRRPIWTGSISPAKRLQEGHIQLHDVNQALASLSDYFLPVTKGRRAVVRCIDGRPSEGYGGRKHELIFEPLGPQVPGGTPTAALIDRLVRGGNVTARLDI